MTAFRKEILFSVVVGFTRNLQRSRELDTIQNVILLRVMFFVYETFKPLHYTKVSTQHKNMIQRRDSDTAGTSHMYEGQKWLALSRRLIAKHMSSKFKRRGYLERASFVCDAFCD